MPSHEENAMHSEGRVGAVEQPVSGGMGVVQGNVMMLASRGAGSTEERLRAVRETKNAIIGNPAKKTLYAQAGAIPLLVEMLAIGRPEEEALAVQAAAALGSFASGTREGLVGVVEAGAIPKLCPLLLLQTPEDEGDDGSRGQGAGGAAGGGTAHGDAVSHRKLVEAVARTLRIIFSSE
eukprot:CAMPEP_0169462394 /NCGR_PEP_ID=MMETSP1042-20121227/19544_1 /TAXON_ID=464988 /ORGANISM="Hemiselmis andersenii, Strain CCMP1180" /LENGTH=178 /DNA_ID=CAMNT_0009575043 /DNA_START=230 /DNA_END=763 /DNA_ORIENTATION=+